MFAMMCLPRNHKGLSRVKHVHRGNDLFPVQEPTEPVHRPMASQAMPDLRETPMAQLNLDIWANIAPPDSTITELLHYTRRGPRLVRRQLFV